MKFKPTGIFVILLSLSMAGCVNRYALSYEDFHGQQPAQMLDGYELCDAAVEIIRTTDFERDARELFRRGYEALGVSSFRGTSDTLHERQMIEHANKVGACKVLVAARYTHTEHGTTSVTTPVTTYHTKTRIIGFDREGRAIKKRTTQETTAYYTDWIPYSSDQYAVNALFLFRKNFVFGAQVAVVPPEVSAKVGKNGGVQILALVRGAPAYKADLFEGDVILAVDGEKLESADMKAQFEEILQRSAGKTISLEIWRNGETVKKSVSLAGGQPDVHSINEA